MDHQNSEAPKPLSGRVERWVFIVTAVVGTLVAVATYVFPRSDDGETPVSSTVKAQASASRTGEGTPQDKASETPAPPPQDGTPLNAIGPVSGQSRLVALPKNVPGGPYTGALMIACPSNDRGDLASEIEYELNREFEALVTAVTMYYPEAGPSAQSELTVFQDSIDRDPGAPPGGPLTKLRLGVSETKPLQAAADRAFFLRIRLQCERTGGFAILNAPTLTPKTP